MLVRCLPEAKVAIFAGGLFGVDQGGAHDLAKFRVPNCVPMIHRFMTSHPVAELLLCFRAKHKDARDARCYLVSSLCLPTG